MAQVEKIIADRGGWFTPAEAAAYYKHTRTLEQGIVLHHWDARAKRLAGSVTFNGTLNYLLHAGVPSANDVIGFDEGAGRIRVVNTVTYPNVAFTSSGANPTNLGKYINCVSVGFEIDPLIEVDGHAQQAGLIEAVAQRALDYCKLANKRLPLSAHRDYASTACPELMPFSRINARLDQLWNEYKNPAPVPPSTAKSTYRRLEKRTWLCNLEPTSLWNLDFTTWGTAKEVAKYSKNHPVDIVGIADHPLSGQYLMTAYAFGNADLTGVPAHNQGFNKKDMVQAPETAPIPPAPTPTPDPLPTPLPEPTPKPELPPTVPTDYDKAQDAKIEWLTGTVNSLIALLREIANSIFNKIGKE